MNFDKLEKKNILAHFSGELKKGQPRRVFNDQLIKELMEKKVMLSQAWSIKMEVPVDMSIDCDKAMSWVQSRIHNFVEAGFFHIGTEAAMQEKTIEGKKSVEPFWFIHVIHPEYKDPRECVKKCVPYEQNYE